MSALSFADFARDVSRQRRAPKGDSRGGQWTMGGSIPINHTTGTNADGSPLPQEMADRLRSLKVPPAWRDVRLSTNPDSPLQATGIDSKNRTQYRYSTAHSAQASAAKFARMKAMIEQLPAIRSQIQKSLAGTGPEHDAAAVLAIIDITGFRIGSDKDKLTTYKAIGVSTLQAKHVRLESPDTIHFNFTAKHGVRCRRKIVDPTLHAIFSQAIAAHPEGRLFNASDAGVRQWLRARGHPFTPKDFRTVVAGETSLAVMEGMRTPRTQKEYRKARSEVGAMVSKRLGNTKAVALKSYVPPEVFAPWQAAVAQAASEPVRKKRRKKMGKQPHQMTTEEFAATLPGREVRSS
jgi:DNA topoisomerase-1